MATDPLALHRHLPNTPAPDTISTVEPPPTTTSPTHSHSPDPVFHCRGDKQSVAGEVVPAAAQSGAASLDITSVPGTTDAEAGTNTAQGSQPVAAAQADGGDHADVDGVPNQADLDEALALPLQVHFLHEFRSVKRDLSNEKDPYLLYVKPRSWWLATAVAGTAVLWWQLHLTMILLWLGYTRHIANTPEPTCVTEDHRSLMATQLAIATAIYSYINRSDTVPTVKFVCL